MTKSNETTKIKAVRMKPLSKAMTIVSPAWDLRLYVAGPTPKSIAAFKNLLKICEEHLIGQYHIEVIDLMKNPQLAQGDQILAVPTLVRKLPSPIRRIIGNLSNTERVVAALDCISMKSTLLVADNTRQTHV